MMTYLRKVHYCCGHAILPKVGHWKPASSRDFRKQNASPENHLFFKQNAAPGNLGPMSTSTTTTTTTTTPTTTVTTTTAKPVFMCGPTEYDPTVSICCSLRVYSSLVYMCCDGQIQGRPIDPGCCSKFAYSRLSHKCVWGMLLPHY